MRILFLTPLLPYPPSSGGLIKTLTVLDYLKRRHSVHVMCFRRSPFSAEQQTYAATLEGQLDCLPLRRGRSIANLMLSYTRRLPLSIYRNRSAEMARLVRTRLSAQQFEAIFVDHWLMAQYPPEDFAGTTILHEHNAEHVIWERQAASERSPALGLMLRAESRRVTAYERAILDRFDVVLAVSEPDRQALIALGADPDRVAILPNVPDPQLLEVPALEYEALPPHVLYIGTLSWQPNIDGLRAFLRDGLPTMRASMPASRLIIAGNEPPEWLRRTAELHPNVDLVSPVPEAGELYSRARVFLEPVRGGGGAKVKVLNALARGLPVVTTADGAGGLEAAHGEHLLVGCDILSLVAGLRQVMHDEPLWRRLSESGRRLVRERYHPVVAYRPLSEAFQRR